MLEVVPSAAVERIESLFPRTRPSNSLRDRCFGVSMGDEQRVAEVVGVLKAVPEDLLLILSQTEAAAFAAQVHVLEVALEGWRGPRSGQVNIRSQSSDGISPLAELRDLLAKCPDASSPTGVAELGFIKDSPFRDVLRRDLASAFTALYKREWKAATVLAGSVLEALLLWAVEQEPDAIEKVQDRPHTKPEGWHLSDLTKVAADASLISETCRTHATSAKDFRNLIHPGRSRRTGAACTHGAALAALAAVQLVVEEFEARYT